MMAALRAAASVRAPSGCATRAQDAWRADRMCGLDGFGPAVGPQRVCVWPFAWVRCVPQLGHLGLISSSGWSPPRVVSKPVRIKDQFRGSSNVKRQHIGRDSVASRLRGRPPSSPSRTRAPFGVGAARRERRLVFRLDLLVRPHLVLPRPVPPRLSRWRQPWLGMSTDLPQRRGGGEWVGLKKSILTSSM